MVNPEKFAAQVEKLLEDALHIRTRLDIDGPTIEQEVAANDAVTAIYKLQAALH